MQDYILTLLLLCSLAISVVYKARLHKDMNPAFFDEDNTKAMRGFWCIIVVMVHIPSLYQNTIQDMVGSFAYIGVTFFFMVSAYGLTISQKKKNNDIRFFWRKRLTRLLVPNWIVNLFSAIIMFLLTCERIDVWALFHINTWVIWLLFCYFVFWLTYLLCKNRSACDIIIAVVIITTSCAMYVLKKQNIVVTGSWPTEMLGFVWGIVLARYPSWFISGSTHQWIKRCVVSCFIALFLGVLYLKFKFIAFLGEYMLKTLLGVAITVFILYLNSRISISNKIAAFLGNISYEVYLIHGSVIVAVATLFPQLSSGVFIACTCILTVLISWVIHLVADTLVKRILNIKHIGG